MMITDTIPQQDIQSAIDRIIRDIAKRHETTEALIILGIANGGIPLGHLLAQGVSQILARTVSVGQISITLHRDDIGRHPIPKAVVPTQIPCNIENHTVILADDVFFSGRTARAAINEVFDQGRPNTVELAVLMDRGHHRLPIKPTYVGIAKEIPVDKQIKVSLDTENKNQHRIEIFLR